MFSAAHAQNGLQDKEDYDFTIKTQTGEIPVHKRILSEKSDYFKTMFKSRMKESYQNSADLQTIDNETMETIIKFMYDSNDAFLNMENVCEYVKAADYLQIPLLKQSCIKMLVANLCTETLFKHWEYAKMYNLCELIEECEIFSSLKYSSLLSEKRFLTVDIELFKAFTALKNKNTATNEIFQSIVAWVEYDVDSRQKHFSQLFEMLNLDKTSQGYLNSTILTNEFVFNSHDCLKAVAERLTKEQKMSPSVAPKLYDVTNQWQDTSESRYRKTRVRDRKHSQFERKSGARNQPQIALEYSDEYEQESCVFILNKSITNKTCVAMFDTTFSKWRDLPPVQNAQISNAGLVSWDKVLYLIGGYNNWGEIGFSQASVYCLHMKNSAPTWHQKADMVMSRHSFGCAVYDNEIYVAGGVQAGTTLKSVESFHILRNQWSERPSMMCKRENCSLVSSDGLLYALGGSRFLMIRHNTVEIFNSHHWKMGPPMLQARSELAAVALNGQIYAIGGKKDPFNYMNSVEKLVNGKWQFVTSLNIGRAGHHAETMNGKIYVVGGRNLFGRLKSVEIYDPVGNEWHYDYLDYLYEEWLVPVIIGVVLLGLHPGLAICFLFLYYVITQIKYQLPPTQRQPNDVFY